MFRILDKITIENESVVLKKVFCNEETNPSALTEFTCCKCGSQNNIEIIPYETGFSITELYKNVDRVLALNILLENKMITPTSRWNLHYGEFTYHDLPTLYFGTACKYCYKENICIFSYGEQQPSLTLLKISGVWSYSII
jgi:hypothetical protein